MATPGETKRPTRRTRIVCISDTHNGTVKVPAGDVLIHAGDITNQGSYSELSKAVKWLEAQSHEVKIVIAGNHDITLDADFYAKHGHELHNKNPESHEKCLNLMRSSSLMYLDHEAVTVRLTLPTGPRTRFTVFGSPRAPAFGHWAFYYPPPDLTGSDSIKTGEGGRITNADLSPWDSIPASADIVVTHTPPRGHCDDSGGVNRPAGCEALRRALWRVRPQLAVCGHMHEGRGVSRVRWDLERRYGELPSGASWEDPGRGANNKISLVDLAGKKGGEKLDNDGQWGEAGLLDEAHGVPAADGQYSTVCAAPGWHGRRETCIVNAAVLKSSYPHKGGKQYHKPIVVDLELPVGEVPTELH